nr:DUF6281 family protein [Nocardioides ochotonae]
MVRTACALVVAAGLSGCSPSATGGGATADCTTAVRFEGTVYLEGGSTTRDAVSLGQGEESSCADVGRDAVGTYFADDPGQVALWSLGGFDPAHVVAVREP